VSATPGRLSVNVDAHVYAGTTIGATVCPQDNRAVMALTGHWMCTIHIYTDRAQLVRLRDAFTAALADLDAGRAALVAELTDTRDTAA